MKAKHIALAAIAALIVSVFSANAGNAIKQTEAEIRSTYLQRHSSVSAHDSDSWTITLVKDEYTLITVIGDGDTDLDIYLYDENGNLIDKDIDDSDNCVVEVTPKWSGKFTLKVKNLGNVYNNYTLIVF